MTQPLCPNCGCEYDLDNHFMVTKNGKQLRQQECSSCHLIYLIDLPSVIPDQAKEQLVAERATKAPNMLCFIEQFPLAMAAIAACHDYERGPLVKGDYRPSLLRHLFGIGEHPDHDAAVAWNAMAQLEIKLRREKEEP